MRCTFKCKLAAVFLKYEDEIESSITKYLGRELGEVIIRF